MSSGHRFRRSRLPHFALEKAYPFENKYITRRIGHKHAPFILINCIDVDDGDKLMVFCKTLSSVPLLDNFSQKTE